MSVPQSATVDPTTSPITYRVIKVQWNQPSKFGSASTSPTTDYEVNAWYGIKPGPLTIGDYIRFEADPPAKLRIIFKNGSIFEEKQLDGSVDYEVTSEGIFDFECEVLDDNGAPLVKGKGGSTPNPGPKRVGIP
jgi:hypothetical protein